LRFDPALELLMQSAIAFVVSRTSPLAWRQLRKAEQSIAGFLQAVGDGAPNAETEDFLRLMTAVAIRHQQAIQGMSGRKAGEHVKRTNECAPRALDPENASAVRAPAANLNGLPMRQPGDGGDETPMAPGAVIVTPIRPGTPMRSGTTSAGGNGRGWCRHRLF
jgi:hypothetical protein